MNDTINNINIREYLTMQDTAKYDIFSDCLNPVNMFNGNKCNTNKLTFDEVQVIKQILKQPNEESIKELIQELYDVKGSFEVSKDSEYYGASIFDLFRCTTFLVEYIKGIIEKENNWFSGVADDKMLIINANERIAPFSHLLTKMNLAEQFSTTDATIGSWKYNKVFTILQANKVNNDLKKEYNEIK